MKVRIVCHKNCFEWILGKFVTKMEKNLIELGLEVTIDDIPDKDSDINHYIPHNAYNCPKEGITTLMVTHIDNFDKLEYITEQAKNASAVICMSNETMGYLAKMGILKKKVCFVNPAHDGLMPIKKIVIGWSCRVQEDGRKREVFIDKLAKKLSPSYFHFRIMGENWEPQVKILKNNGFHVDYFNKFDYEYYPQFISSLDYYLYMGLDEGQMGFVDALAAGVKTIVTKQGYHLDAKNGITYPFLSYEELENIFLELQTQKEKLVESVSTWTWRDYCLKHIEIWKYLLGEKNLRSSYTDGLNSLREELNFEDSKSDYIFQKAQLKKLKKQSYWQKYYVFKNRLSNFNIKRVLQRFIQN